MNEVDNVFLRLLQGGIYWTFWNPANDDDVLADLLDQTLIEVAPELISYKSAAMENCHQDATGAYYKVREEEHQKWKAVIPLGARDDGHLGDA